MTDLLKIMAQIFDKLQAEQVDILISKNQVLQILYLKHNEIYQIILNNHSIQC